MKVPRMMTSSGLDLTWLQCPFDDLTARQVHGLLRLRQQIFVIEQHCIFPEIDGLDPECFHIIALQNAAVVAAARIVGPGIDPDHDQQGNRPAIGRVAVGETFRSQGLGRVLMAKSIAACDALFSQRPIFLNAQLYLKNFYQDLGFKQISDVFDEDGIPHISMERQTG